MMLFEVLIIAHVEAVCDKKESGAVRRICAFFSSLRPLCEIRHQVTASRTTIAAQTQTSQEPCLASTGQTG